MALLFDYALLVFFLILAVGYVVHHYRKNQGTCDACKCQKAPTSLDKAKGQNHTPSKQSKRKAL